MVSFDKNVHFIDEEDIVTYEDFDCGFTFNPESPTKIRQINREQNYISRSCEKPQCIPSNDQHICVVDELHSSNRLNEPVQFMGPGLQQHFCHSATLLIHTLCSNQYPQPTTQQPRADSYPVFSSLRTRNSKRKGIARQFCILSKKLHTGRTNERNSC